MEVTVPVLTIVTANVLKEVARCTVASASETNPEGKEVGKEASKPGAAKSIVVGKPCGSVPGTIIGFVPAGVPPFSVSSNCARFTTRGSDRSVVLNTTSGVTIGAAGTAAPISLPKILNVTISPDL